MESAGKPQREAEFQPLPEPRFPWGRVLLVAALYFASTAAFPLLFTPQDPSEATYWKLIGWGSLALSLGTLHLYPISRRFLEYSSRFKAHSKSRTDLVGSVIIGLFLTGLVFYIRTIPPGSPLASYLYLLACFLVLIGFVQLPYSLIESPSTRWASFELLEKELNMRFSLTASVWGLVTALILVLIPPLLALFVILLMVSVTIVLFIVTPSSSIELKYLLLLVIILAVPVGLYLLYLKFTVNISPRPPTELYLIDFLKGMASLASFALKFPLDWSIDLLASHVPAPLPPKPSKACVCEARRGGSGDLFLSFVLEREAEEGGCVKGEFIALADANSRGGGSGGLLCASGRARLVKRRDDSPSGFAVYIPGERSALLDAYLKLGSGLAGVSRLIVLLTLRYTFPLKGTLTETHVLLVEPGEERVEELFRFAGEPSGLKLAITRAEPQATH